MPEFREPVLDISGQITRLITNLSRVLIYKDALMYHKVGLPGRLLLLSTRFWQREMTRLQGLVPPSILNQMKSMPLAGTE